MTTGVIIVAFRDPTALERGLESVRTCDEVVVVNVTADPRVAEIVAAAGRSCLEMVENVGYAAAVNAAEPMLGESVTDVLFMNDDVALLSPPPTASIAPVRIPVQRGPSGDAPDLHPFPTPTRFIAHWIVGLRRSVPMTGGPAPHASAANGAAVIVRRDVLRRHPLPAEYFLYWEETAWFWRLSDSGIRPVIDSDVIVERPSGRDELSNLKAELLGRNLVRLAHERYGRAGRAGYTALGLAWIVRCAVIDLLRGPRLELLRYRRAMLRGLYGGIRQPFGRLEDAQ